MNEPVRKLNSVETDVSLEILKALHTHGRLSGLQIVDRVAGWPAGASSNKTGAFLAARLEEMVTDGLLATLRGDYWIARSTGEYVCEAAGRCWCAELEASEHCECVPEAMDASRSRCLHCRVSMVEMEPHDPRVWRPWRPFVGRFLPMPPRPRTTRAA
jgi:hypothetical protein